MAFSVSPGVNVSEIDLSTSIAGVSTTEAGIAGVFAWGPVNERVLVNSEVTLVDRFGKVYAKRTDLADANTFWTNADTFFSASDFLAYSDSLYVVRVASSDAFNAGANSQVLTQEAAEALTSEGNFIARYPGVLGNSLEVSICPSSTEYSEVLSANLSISVGSNTASFAGNTDGLLVGDYLEIDNQFMEVSAISNSSISFLTTFKGSANVTNEDATRYWKYYNRFDRAPGTNEIHVVVVDKDGEITGANNTVIEVYSAVSITPTAKTETGATNFYQNVINQQSKWIYATGNLISSGDITTNQYLEWTDGSNGDDETAVALGVLTSGYDLFVSPEDVEVSLLIQGRARGGANDAGLANYIIDNICEVRKDCVLFVSPSYADVVNNQNALTDIVAFRNSLSSSSYAFIDSGYKYRYDKYNDVYRYTPLNGDIAGLAARTDDLRDPWFSFAGYTRGLIKNIIKVAYNPRKADRDVLYRSDVNSVIVEPGTGALLYGDKTAIGRSSAFDRVNVRRLFIVLEKAVARAAKTTLFEINDPFTRAQFRNLVEPFLRDVQGRRGVTDFRVVCDDTNNTPEVVDRNEFRGDIYIKPARSINYIQLNFVAVRTGVEFSEIVGQF